MMARRVVLLGAAALGMFVSPSVLSQQPVTSTDAATGGTRAANIMRCAPVIKQDGPDYVIRNACDAEIWVGWCTYPLPGRRCTRPTDGTVLRGRDDFVHVMAGYSEATPRDDARLMLRWTACPANAPSPTPFEDFRCGVRP